MSTLLSSKLSDLFQQLQEEAANVERSDVSATLSRLQEAANKVERSWSGSCLGYHAHVYYAGFAQPPPGAYFNPVWGTTSPQFGQGSVGNWVEYNYDQVRDVIYSTAGDTDLRMAERVAKDAKETFESGRRELIAFLNAVMKSNEDSFLERLVQEASELRIISSVEYERAFLPPSGATVMSQDSRAMSQGFIVPPHSTVLATVLGLRNPAERCRELAEIVKQSASYLSVSENSSPAEGNTGKKIFIGHGRSRAWKELKDFIQDRLLLDWDEFERQPPAGYATAVRLEQMLDDAAMAFLVLTAEDEQADGTLRARMNVVHELGLFQGRLGFNRAIVLLEEGCEEFSNISGLIRIQFPKDQIETTFEKIRQVLEREDIIST